MPFQCVAACIETAGSTWLSTGELVDPVVASCSVPGLFPAVEIDGQHYLDGGLVHSIPVGRAVSLGADRIFVLQVGRVEQPLTPPRRPWEVGVVAFEIVPGGRQLAGPPPAPEEAALHLAGALLPLAPAYPLPFYLASERA